MLSELGLDVHVSRLDLVKVFLDPDAKLPASLINIDSGAISALKVVNTAFLEEENRILKPYEQFTHRGEVVKGGTKPLGNKGLGELRGKLP